MTLVYQVDLVHLFVDLFSPKTKILCFTTFWWIMWIECVFGCFCVVVARKMKKRKPLDPLFQCLFCVYGCIAPNKRDYTPGKTPTNKSFSQKWKKKLTLTKHKGYLLCWNKFVIIYVLYGRSLCSSFVWVGYKMYLLNVYSEISFEMGLPLTVSFLFAKNRENIKVNNGRTFWKMVLFNHFNKFYFLSTFEVVDLECACHKVSIRNKRFADLKS